MKIIQLVGIPASGKSTYAAILAAELNAAIINGDTIRGELSGGDETDQSNNTLIFNKIIPERIIENIKNGVPVILDNTGICVRDRKMALDHGKLLSVEVECHYFEPNLDQARIWNKQRTRVVPDFVFDRMLAKWQVPTNSEGFSKIINLTKLAEGS